MITIWAAKAAMIAVFASQTTITDGKALAAVSCQDQMVLYRFSALPRRSRQGMVPLDSGAVPHEVRDSPLRVPVPAEAEARSPHLYAITI